MGTIVTEPTATAQWQLLVSEAATACDCTLDQELESYLVFLLMRFSSRPEMASSILALDFLRANQVQGSLHKEQLRDVGDQCLLYSGLFPKRASRRLVNIRYFVDLGRASYEQIAGTIQQGYVHVYERLSEYFVLLMDVLQAMRELDGRRTLDIITLHELRDECGSIRARRILNQECYVVPITRIRH